MVITWPMTWLLHVEDEAGATYIIRAIRVIRGLLSPAEIKEMAEMISLQAAK